MRVVLRRGELLGWNGIWREEKSRGGLKEGRRQGVETLRTTHRWVRPDSVYDRSVPPTRTAESAAQPLSKWMPSGLAPSGWAPSISVGQIRWRNRSQQKVALAGRALMTRSRRAGAISASKRI